MTQAQKLKACMRFFEELAEELEKEYEVLGSCNHDSSVYLVPKGKSDQVTYYGKPMWSFRVSDHWNWFTSLNKNSDEHYVQCFSIDMPYPRRRALLGQATEPRKGCQVAFFGRDRKYHCVFGERYDRKTKSWEWVNGSIEDAIKLVASRG